MRIIPLALAVLTGCSFFQSAPTPTPTDPPDPEPAADARGYWPKESATAPVRWSDPTEAYPVKGNHEEAPVTPLPPQPPPAPAAFADLIPAMEAIARARPDDAALQVRLATLYALNEQYEQAMAVFEKLPAPSGGDSWHRLDLVHRSMRWIVMRNLGVRDADAEFEKMAEAIAHAHGMEIVKAELATAVHGLEDFDPREGRRFAPGETALIYLQVRNFDLNETDGTYRFHLKYRWQLIDGLGQDQTPEDWRKAPPEACEDVRTLAGKRRDFWQTFALRFPIRAGGRYTIRITVVDVVRGNHSQAVDIPIEMGDFTPPPPSEK